MTTSAAARAQRRSRRPDVEAPANRTSGGAWRDDAPARTSGAARLAARTYLFRRPRARPRRHRRAVVVGYRRPRGVEISGSRHSPARPSRETSRSCRSIKNNWDAL